MKIGFGKRNIGRAVALMIVLALTLSITVCASAASDAQKLDAYYSLAISYIEREDFDKAMEYIDACFNYCDETTNAPLCADLHLKRGCVYTMQEDYASALTELDEALRINPELADALLVKTQVYANTEKVDEAIDTLQNYIDVSGDTSMYETLAQMHQQSGETENALKDYDSYAESISGSEIEASYNKALYRLGLTMYPEAIEAFEVCEGDETYGPSSSYNIGICYMNLNDYENALAAFTRSKEAGATFDGISYNMGVCNMSLGSFEEAIEAFTASVEGESFKEDAMYNRAVCYMSLGNYDEAIADYTGYIDELKAAAEAAEGGEDETAEPLSTVDLATYYRGVCYLSAGEFAKAAEDFTTCMENGVAETDSLFNRGLSYLQGGEFEPSVEDFTACIEGGNSVDEAHYYRSFAYRYLGQNEQALEDLTACIENGYSLAQSYYQRAQVYNDIGDNDHYVEDLEASLNY